MRTSPSRWRDRHRTAISLRRCGRYASVLLLALLVTGCVPGANGQQGIADATGEVAGFWPGLWHGVIAPVTFFISLFTDDVSVYEIHNSGNWYDFGFVIGAGILVSGGAAGARKRS